MQLFACEWNTTKTNSYVHFNVKGKKKLPCILVIQLTRKEMTHSTASALNPQTTALQELM